MTAVGPADAEPPAGRAAGKAPGPDGDGTGGAPETDAQAVPGDESDLGDEDDDDRDDGDTDAETHADGRRRRSAPARIARGLLAAGILLLLFAGWVSWRTYQAYRSLDRASQQISVLQEQVKELDRIDLAATSATVDRLHADTRDAVGATSDPLFRLAGQLPFLGPNLRALRTVAGTADALAGTTAPALVSVATVTQPSSLSPRNGAVDIAPIARAAATLTGADQQVRAAQADITGIDQRQLAEPVARAVSGLQVKLAALAQTTAKAARIGRLAPPMLGADGPRRYLVVFENLAEPRATGGLFGSYAELTVTAGRLDLTGQGSVARDIGRIDGRFEPALPVPVTLPAALYGRLPGAYSTDTNLTPDFPTAVTLLARMYQLRHRVSVDGVLALDPVALGYLLQDSAPIPVGAGLSMTSGNITRILLSKAYQLYPQSADAPARDLFLADATSRAFTAVMTSPADASSVVRGLTRAANEHRLLLWSSHPAEQLDLAGTAIAQLLPAPDGAHPAIGVFRNDGTGGKLGFYADGSAALTAGSCDAAQRQVTLTLQMDYSAPTSGLPAYVLGYARAGPYVLRTDVLVFAPPGSTIDTVRVDGRQVSVVTAQEGGRAVAMVTVDQRPAQHAEVVATLLIPAPADLAAAFSPAVVLTPGITNWTTTTTTYPACPAPR